MDTEKVLSDDAAFLMTLMPGWVTNVIEGLEPSMYGTLTIEGDKKVHDRVKGILESMSIKFTDELPDQEGVYWYRTLRKDDSYTEPQMCAISMGYVSNGKGGVTATGFTITYLGDCDIYGMDGCNHQFAGPIQPPSTKD